MRKACYSKQAFSVHSSRPCPWLLVPLCFLSLCFLSLFLLHKQAFVLSGCNPTPLPLAADSLTLGLASPQEGAAAAGVKRSTLTAQAINKGVSPPPNLTCVAAREVRV